jgi:flagellar biosynthetic protein FlhB
VALLLFLALLDYAYQRWEHEKELRMTKQEAADEMKLMEGDPEVRKRRQTLARQLSRQRMMKMVERADVVITNPTELAVALRYDERTMRAPRVVAKGARRMASRIRAVATLAGVPIVERKPLAQSLWRLCEVGDSVPPELYQAVAEILAFLMKLDKEQGN